MECIFNLAERRSFFFSQKYSQFAKKCNKLSKLQVNKLIMAWNSRDLYFCTVVFSRNFEYFWNIYLINYKQPCHSYNVAIFNIVIQKVRSEIQQTKPYHTKRLIWNHGICVVHRIKSNHIRKQKPSTGLESAFENSIHSTD